MNRILAALGIALLLVVPAVAAAADRERVIITDTFRPAQLEIEPGTSVTWHNRDVDRHRVRSKDGPVEFDSGNLERGERFSFMFSVPCIYPYYDHRDRDDTAYTGTIIVGDAAVPDGPLADGASVSIIDKSFQPFSVAIATGGTVEWSNDDGEGHTVTAADSVFDSGILAGGGTFSQTFDTAGSHQYLCLIHPEMRGTIEVRDPDPTTASPDSIEGPAEPPEPVEAPAVPAIEGPDLDGALDTLEAREPDVSTVVSVDDRAFQPAAIEVAAGSTVRWSNDDTEGHTVTATEGEFNSGILTVGDAFDTTFEEPGTFDYFCAIHPEMQGTVVVKP